MSRLARIGLALLLITPSRAAAAAPPEAVDDAAGLRTTWSMTWTGQYTQIPSPEDANDVGGYFDQYRFTPNKSSSVPFEFWLDDGSFDLLRRDETAVLQLRFESPTSNLGLSGSQIDDAFFNQRLDALTRLEGFEIDLDYSRIRTEQLRLFPDTAGPGLVFQDLTRPTDRFYRDRTKIGGEARIRPYDAFDLRELPGDWLEPELSLRGGHESRDAKEQLRILRGPSNDWIGLREKRDRSVSQVGGGLLLAPDGLLTLTFDFDHERLRFDSAATTEADLGYSGPRSSRAIGFVPETNRNTGTLRLNSRIGDRTVLEAGFQISQLDQVGNRTPNQDTAGLEDNSVRTYSANAAVDVVVAEDLSFNGFLKFDRRENDIERDTSSFNPDNGTQVDPFVKDWQRFFVGGELVLRSRRADRVAIGVRYEDVARDLDFARPVGLRIVPDNAVVGRDTRIVTLYGQTTARPWRGLRLNAELGYGWAPETGYATDLDDHVYGQLRGSYVVPLPRSPVLSAYVRGGRGKNDDFTMVSGQGSSPPGPRLRRSNERWNVAVGATASASPVDRLNLYASFYYAEARQKTSFDLSTLQRYFQDSVPILFTNNGRSRFANKQISSSVGMHVQLTDRADAELGYTFTRAKARYVGSASSIGLALISDNRVIDSIIHVADFELGYRIRDGLRLRSGYQFRRYVDDSPVVRSIASVVSPFDLATHQHTVTLGVTLTNDLFSRSD